MAETKNTFKRIGIYASPTRRAQKALAELNALYKLIPLDLSKHDPHKKPDVDVVIALGGDGYMLRAIHACIGHNLPIYGMNCGTTGFLLNSYHADNLLDRLAAAQRTTIHPLKVKVDTLDDKEYHLLAVNEVSLLRHTRQAAKLRIYVDDMVRMKELVGDGVLVATPAGSSAYNASVGGPILPMKTPLLSMTAVSPFRPRRWRGAILPDNVTVAIDCLYPDTRPVNAVADYTEIAHVTRIELAVAHNIKINLLFDAGHSLEERILEEQFT